MKLFILFFISLFFKLNFQFCFAEIEKYAFERKLDNDKSPDFVLLKFLSHPEHFIFPEQNSFYNKTELIYAVGGFADSSIKFEDLREQIKERWEQIGGEQTQIVTLMSGIEKMFEEAKLKITEKLRATLLVLYSLGCKILEGKIESGYNVIFETDKIFAYGLNDNFKKVLKVLSGLNPAKDTRLNELVENAELLDKLTGIGSKVEIKYPKSSNEPINFALMIENVGDAEKMSGQLLTEIIDKIMHEVIGNEGGWGYVKSENDEISKISKEELINEEIEKNDKIIFDENKEKIVIEDSKSDNILVNILGMFYKWLGKIKTFFSF